MESMFSFQHWKGIRKYLSHKVGENLIGLNILLVEHTTCGEIKDSYLYPGTQVSQTDRGVKGITCCLYSSPPATHLQRTLKSQNV